MKGPGRWYTTVQVAAALGVLRTTVLDWIRAGKLKASQPAGKYGCFYISEQDFKACMSRGIDQVPIEVPRG